MAAREHPHLLPGRPWDHRPEPESTADIDQALAAKLHLGMRITPLLAAAELVVVEPSELMALPGWSTEREATAYGSRARLPASPVFLDLEAVDGTPVAWEAPTWPRPLHLRGALCWA